MSDSDTPQTDDTPQPLVSHLVELRNRLIHAIVAVLVIFVGLISFANEIYTFVSEPLRRFLPEGSSMIATEVASPFLTPFKLTFVAAIFIAIPYILHQIWCFIAPGMYQHEKKVAAPVLVSSVLLFYAGIAFAYFAVFPVMFGFLSASGPADIAYTPDIARFLDIVLKLFFAFGIAFEIPIATILLVAAGVTTPQSLSEKRPYIIVGCFVFAMLLTPPDPISQCLMAIPMWLLFEAGVFFGRMFYTDEDNS
jgi:sec-independent protein translocase protein TatC